MYENGYGKQKNYDAAYKWYLLAAKKGHSDAQNKIGLKCSNEKKYDEALKWFQLAAKQGRSDAQYNIGFLYANKEGNYNEAIKWYQMAAERGNTDAQWEIGNMYENGIEVKRNYKDAFNWYMQSAKKGHAKAQYNIGVMFEKGNGVNKDYIEAKKYFQLAANQGNLDAQNKIQKIIEKEKNEYTEEKNKKIFNIKDNIAQINQEYIDKINKVVEKILQIEIEINHIRLEFDTRKKQENEIIEHDKEINARLENELIKAKRIEKQILIQIDLIKKIKNEKIISQNKKNYSLDKKTNSSVNILIDKEARRFEDMF
jgi:TPR repeat protein